MGMGHTKIMTELRLHKIDLILARRARSPRLIAHKQMKDGMVWYGIGSDRLVCGGESRMENRDGGEMGTYSSASKHAADIHLYLRQTQACAAGESNKAEIINLFHASKSQQPSRIRGGG